MHGDEGKTSSLWKLVLAIACAYCVKSSWEVVRLSECFCNYISIGIGKYIGQGSNSSRLEQVE